MAITMLSWLLVIILIGGLLAGAVASFVKHRPKLRKLVYAYTAATILTIALGSWLLIFWVASFLLRGALPPQIVIFHLRVPWDSALSYMEEIAWATGLVGLEFALSICPRKEWGRLKLVPLLILATMAAGLVYLLPSPIVDILLSHYYGTPLYATRLRAGFGELATDLVSFVTLWYLVKIEQPRRSDSNALTASPSNINGWKHFIRKGFYPYNFLVFSIVGILAMIVAITTTVLLVLGYSSHDEPGLLSQIGQAVGPTWWTLSLVVTLGYWTCYLRVARISDKMMKEAQVWTELRVMIYAITSNGILLQLLTRRIDAILTSVKSAELGKTLQTLQDLVMNLNYFLRTQLSNGKLGFLGKFFSRSTKPNPTSSQRTNGGKKLRRKQRKQRGKQKRKSHLQALRSHKHSKQRRRKGKGKRKK